MGLIAHFRFGTLGLGESSHGRIAQSAMAGD